MINTVKNILDGKGRGVWTISPQAKVIDALKLMAEKDVGALVVTSDGHIKGMFSERDYARKIILRGKSSLDTPVHEIMTERTYFVKPETPVDHCMALMSQQRIRHLPVLHNGKLEGLVSIGDIVKSIIDEQKLTIEQLEDYIAGKYL